MSTKWSFIDGNRAIDILESLMEFENFNSWDLSDYTLSYTSFERAVQKLD